MGTEALVVITLITNISSTPWCKIQGQWTVFTAFVWLKLFGIYERINVSHAVICVLQWAIGH